ncbi:glycosyltransferase family 4 protein [Microgenomates group bacterium]|nr:glycosyltransferase family 4 protein [Microgenomates group bacterium]
MSGIKVGLDATSLVYGRGVSRYTANLIRALTLQSADIDLSVYAVANKHHRKELSKAINSLRPEGGERFALHLETTPLRLQQLKWRLGLSPISRHFPNLEVLHSWDYLQPPDKNIPLVSTIHDVSMLKYPDTAHSAILAAHQYSWRLLQDRGAQIITDSQQSREDIINYLGFAPYQVTTIPLAVPQETIDLAHNLTSDQYQIIQNELLVGPNYRPYIFFVGTREPRKNLSRMIAAWQSLDVDLDFIIAGAEGWDRDIDFIPSPSRQLRFLGRVSDAQLAVLYNEAQFLAFCSLDEGFGLPVLEAFYYGTRVLTSDIPVMREVGGDAAVFVNPQDKESIRQGMINLLEENTKKQTLRAQKMRLQNEKFSWQKTAQDTIAVYQKSLTS